MKETWQFIAIGLNGVLLLGLLTMSLSPWVSMRDRVFLLVMATAPASALLAIGRWRKPKQG